MQWFELETVLPTLNVSIWNVENRFCWHFFKPSSLPSPLFFVASFCSSWLDGSIEEHSDIAIHCCLYCQVLGYKVLQKGASAVAVALSYLDYLVSVVVMDISVCWSVRDSQPVHQFWHQLRVLRLWAVPVVAQVWYPAVLSSNRK